MLNAAAEVFLALPLWSQILLVVGMGVAAVAVLPWRMKDWK